MTQADTARITIVTGLPRSGTSMMMQMLAAGGCPILTDGIRSADSNNPHGYLEYEPVKRLPFDSSWLHLARGRALKVLAALLPYIPIEPTLQYQVVFMHRDWREVADSQLRMLRNLGREHLSQPASLVERGMQQDLITARTWLTRHSIPVIDVDYTHTLIHPRETADRLAALFPVFHLDAALKAVRTSRWP